MQVDIYTWFDALVTSMDKVLSLPILPFFYNSAMLLFSDSITAKYFSAVILGRN